MEPRLWLRLETGRFYVYGLPHRIDVFRTGPLTRIIGIS
jgi:hypothetical protein